MADRPLCLLALNGGRIRGLSELVILEEIMSRIKHDLDMDEDPIPADFFDMIGGTSTGGFVCAVRKHDVQATAGPTLFRTYRVRRNATYNCTIWEAFRATSAAPPYFDPISIGDPGEEEIFIDGGLGYNNPTEQLLDEARRQFPERKVACIVSIGTGMARVIHFPDSPKTSPKKLIDALKNMATEADTTAERVQVRFQDTQDTYFRFNVNRGLEDLMLDEWKNLGKVRGYTSAYLNQSVVSSHVDVVVKALVASKVVPRSDGSTTMVSISGRASKVDDSHKQPPMLSWHTSDPIPDFQHKIEDLARSRT
ncbi:hypothetical protein Sste5346_009543 [Sporothrix stenoceras]|uniref:PNPLA domain-containing protein n=1 Tax=Sporothrix stenoceras TaxID=5173 RepID=A0ABR3YJD5_9PEZI